ncbi:MAG TPA: SPOR domain-containing protein [Rhizomicrobium sp.]
MGPDKSTGLRLALMFLAWPVFFASAAAGPVSADAASVAMHAGNASNAVALATQALADPNLSPRDRARILVDRGLGHEMLGERDAALIDLTEAINARALLGPEQARAFYDRGVTLDELSRTEDAVGDYSAAILLEPKFAAALNNRGNAYRRLNRLAEARADYQASVAAANAHLEYPNFGLGQVAEAAGQIDEARGYYRAALAANPQFELASQRLNALGNGAPATVAPPADNTVHLHPPGQAAANANPTDDGTVHLRPPRRAGVDADLPANAEVHLRPPGERAIRLHPPRAARAAPPPGPAPGLDLKPAFSEGGGSTVSQTIQLGAWRSEADAADAWNRINSTGGNLLAGLSPQVVPVDLPGKGRYYRLRAGPIYPGNAPGLCVALKAKGLACVVVAD